MLPTSLRLPLTFDPVRLRLDLGRILTGEYIPHFNTSYYQGDWSVVPLRSIGGRADQIYPDPTRTDAFRDTPLLERCDYVREVLATLRCPLQSARFLRLAAGSTIREHRDFRLGFEDGEVRLHIPVVTHADVEFILDGRRVVMAEGECWYNNFNLPHSVANRGTVDRVHLVVDCGVSDWLAEMLQAAAAALPSRTERIA